MLCWVTLEYEEWGPRKCREQDACGKIYEGLLLLFFLWKVVCFCHTCLYISSKETIRKENSCIVNCKKICSNTSTLCNISSTLISIVENEFVSLGLTNFFNLDIYLIFISIQNTMN